MPLYEDLARRAVEANERARSLSVDSQRIRGLAELLRDAHAGEVMLVRCAWCGRLQVGGEWLLLDAVVGGQLQITTSLAEQASHGICPGCFDSQLRQSAAGRAAGDSDAAG